MQRTIRVAVRRLRVGLLGGILVAGTLAVAQVEPQGGSEARPQFSAERALARMAKRLKLTAEQQQQIKPILEDRHQQMQSLRGDTSLSRDDRMQKMKSIIEDGNAKIEAVLDDTQKEKFKKEQAAMSAHPRSRGGDDSSSDGAPDGPPDGPPPDGAGPPDGGPPPGGPPGT